MIGHSFKPPVPLIAEENGYGKANSIKKKGSLMSGPFDRARQTAIRARVFLMARKHIDVNSNVVVPIHIKIRNKNKLDPARFVGGKPNISACYMVLI
jgi:hypothetical protein